ncbi:MAG TPA: GDSL-type esterase/lipase family protein [Xanthobacteraceae bacterium]|nr:GDSL-type esterase/lipase family protein [Xanthobacteraceae bacterium]
MGLSRVSRVCVAAAVAGITLALLLPAQAQFWDWGGRPQRQQQWNNNWGGWGGGGWNDRRYDERRYYDPYRQEREAPVDYSRAPPSSQKKPEATTSIVVMGDANADWLAYGLEDAFSENPEVAVVRKHRTDSGLIRYDQRRDLEWPQVAREIIAAEKPKFIVVMLGNNDRQTIREKAPPAARPGTPKPNAQAGQPAPSATPPIPAPPPDPEQQPPAPAEAAEHANMTPEQARQASYGPWEFHTEKWELAYVRRIDAMIAALKSAGVPVLWVGLPSQRNTKTSADSLYLNELYRGRAEKAGIIYVDIWDGFVDEGGRYSQQGPDYEGQIRRLRSGDGVYYTKFGARKLAHYVEREIQRSMTNRSMPVALPAPTDSGSQAAKPGAPAQRPAAGPVVPLTAMQVAPEELIGGGRASAADANASRVLTKGEPIAAPSGRADDFSWPRGSALKVQPTAPDNTGSPAAPVMAPDDASAPAKGASGKGAATADSGQVGATAEQKPAAQRRPRRSNPHAQRPFFFPNFFR